jgi:hypothetical protein
LWNAVDVFGNKKGADEAHSITKCYEENDVGHYTIEKEESLFHRAD